jgi:hypothetical protein
LLEHAHPQSSWIDVIAALCPPSHRAQLQFRLSELPPELTATALSLLEILEALEKAQEKAGNHA